MKRKHAEKDYQTNFESGIRRTGVEYKLVSCANRFELSKEDVWEEAMADQTKVIVIPLSEAKRKHLHERLDMWMDNNWRFE
jgi:hypothetical protein